jgi:hypothetical protein
MFDAGLAKKRSYASRLVFVLAPDAHRPWITYYQGVPGGPGRYMFGMRLSTCLAIELDETCMPAAIDHMCV